LGLLVGALICFVADLADAAKVVSAPPGAIKAGTRWKAAAPGPLVVQGTDDDGGGMDTFVVRWANNAGQVFLPQSDSVAVGQTKELSPNLIPDGEIRCLESGANVCNFQILDTAPGRDALLIYQTQVVAESSIVGTIGFENAAVDATQTVTVSGNVFVAVATSAPITLANATLTGSGVSSPSVTVSPFVSGSAQFSGTAKVGPTTKVVLVQITLIVGGQTLALTASRALPAAPPPAQLTLSPPSLPVATAGVFYDVTIGASGGAAPYTFVVSSGSLPAGLTLSSGGRLSGTPAASGSSGFTVTAADSGSPQATGQQPYVLTVDPPALQPPSSCTLSANPAQVLPGGTVTLTASCAGGGPPTSYAWTGPGTTPTTTSPSQTVAVASPPATYTVIASNPAGAAPQASANVGAAPPPLQPPSSCTLSANPAQVSPGGTVTLTASCAGGGVPTSYAWTGPGATPTTTSPSQTVTVAAPPATYTVVASNSAGGAPPASASVSAAASTPAAITNQSGTPPPSTPGAKVPLAVKVVDAQGNPVSNAQFTSTVSGGNGTLAQVTPAPPDGIYLFEFTLGSDTTTRTIRICLTNVQSSCAQFVVTTTEASVIAPAQQLTSPQIAAAVTAPAIQIGNIRQHLDQLRFTRYAAVTQALRVSVDGRALPPLGGGARAPPTKDGKPQPPGGDANGPQTGGGAAADKPGDAFARWGAFVNGDIDVGRQSATDTQSGFKLTSKGLTLGADYRFDGGHVLGAALGLAKSDSNLSDVQGSQDTKGYSFSLFGSFVPATNAYIDAIVNFGHTRYDSQRQAADGGSIGSSTDGDAFAFAVSAGANFTQGAFTANPYGRVEYVDAKVDGFTENGSADQALTISEQRVKATTLALGGQVSYAISTSWGVLLPYGKAEFQYLAQTNAQDVTAQLVGIGSPTIVPKVGQDKSFGAFAAGASAILPNGVSGFFNYEQLFGKDNYKGQRYTLGLRVEF
jgi:uncharacterized protein YhjY with autotransporter beta-barrel domain